MARYCLTADGQCRSLVQSSDLTLKSLFLICLHLLRRTTKENHGEILTAGSFSTKSTLTRAIVPPVPECTVTRGRVIVPGCVLLN